MSGMSNMSAMSNMSDMSGMPVYFHIYMDLSLFSVNTNNNGMHFTGPVTKCCFCQSGGKVLDHLLLVINIKVLLLNIIMYTIYVPLHKIAQYRNFVLCTFIAHCGSIVLVFFLFFFLF